MSGTRKGRFKTKLDRACKIERSKSKAFINMNISSCRYQCYCLSSYFTICYYFIFPQKCKSVLYFLHLLRHDPQDILLLCRMVIYNWLKMGYRKLK